MLRRPAIRPTLIYIAVSGVPSNGWRPRNEAYWATLTLPCSYIKNVQVVNRCSCMLALSVTESCQFENWMNGPLMQECCRVSYSSPVDNTLDIECSTRSKLKSRVNRICRMLKHTRYCDANLKKFGAPHDLKLRWLSSSDKAISTYFVPPFLSCIVMSHRFYQDIL